MDHNNQVPNGDPGKLESLQHFETHSLVDLSDHATINTDNDSYDDEENATARTTTSTIRRNKKMQFHPVHIMFHDDIMEENLNTTELVRTRSQIDFEQEEEAEEKEVTQRRRLGNDDEKEIIMENKNKNTDMDMEDDMIPFSILQRKQKTMIVLLIAFIGMFSAILQPIYFPILPLMQHKFHVSEEMMNLSVVLYLIFQGLAPTMMSNLADKIGRRPVILLCLLIYIVANIGLALLNVYWLILVLRCIQAAGIAPVISINSGVVGDITQRHERGSYVGAVSGITLVGQGFGALIGLVLASSKFGWRSIFWFLAILPGVTLLFAFCVLPETKRSIVGNLSVKPPRLINKAPILFLPFIRRKLVNQYESLAPGQSNFDLFALFKIMLLPEVACALFPSSIIFTTWTMSMTSYTSVLSNSYHYKTLHIGLCYLPTGLGALCGSLTCGRVLDFVYRWEKKKYTQKYPPTMDNRPKFNIFKARLQMFILPSSIMTIFTIIFGWTLQHRIAVSVVMVSQFFMSFSSTFPITMCTTVLIDIFPGKSSTSTSLVNFSRCILALVGVAAMSKMIKAMELGGCYTFMACLCFVGNAFIYLSVFKGETWAANRAIKEKLKSLDIEEMEKNN